MQSLDVFLSRLLPKVPGCPDPLARQALVDSAIEFCEETSITQYTSEPQDVLAGVATYDVDLPSQQDVVVVLKAWYGAQRLTPAPAERVDSILAYVASAGTATVQQGDAHVYYEYAPGVVALYPVPKESRTAMFSARIATKPKRSATMVEDILTTDWIESIVAGAAYRLCSMQGQAFTNDITATREYNKFWADISKATNIALRGRLRTSITVRPRPAA